MNMMKILMMFFVLSACKTKIICNQIEQSNIGDLLMCGPSFSHDQPRCSCVCVNYESMRIIPGGCGGQAGTYPVERCDDFRGFYIKDYAEKIEPNHGRLMEIKKDYCK